MFTISSAVFLLISSCRPNCRSKHISGVGGQMAPKSGILEPSKHTSGAEVSTFRNSGNYTDQLVKVPKGPRQRRKDTHFLQNGIHNFLQFRTTRAALLFSHHALDRGNRFPGATRARYSLRGPRDDPGPNTICSFPLEAEYT
jgi:hypothetical protein